MSIDTMTFVGINILLAWSFYVILLTGTISLGNGAFMAIGAYTSSLITLNLGWSLPLALVCGMALAALFGVLFALPALRTKGIYLLMVTIGIGEATRVFFENFAPAGGIRGLGGMTGTTTWGIYLCVLLVLLFLYLLSRSPLQRMFLAVKEDERVAGALGMNVAVLKILSVMFGSAIAALAGGLFAHYLAFISPGNFGMWQSFLIGLYVILGGTNNLWGPILGAAVYTLLPELLRNVGLVEWRLFIFAVGIVILMAFRPNGLIHFRVGERRLTATPLAGDGRRRG